MTLVDQATNSGTLIANNTTYLYVGKVVGSSTGNAEAFFTRYATTQTLPLTEPVTWSLNIATSGQSTLSADRIVFTGGSNRTVTYDEIRIGSSWDAVVIPEPTTAALAIGMLSLGAVLLRRRYRS